MKKEMKKRAKVHDMDKMLLYLFFGQREVQEWHVKNQPHHLESGLGNTYFDLVETVIDYECAPYTKPDKPLNAYDFVCKLVTMGYLKQGKADELIRIMHDFGIDHSSEVAGDEEGFAYLKQFEEISEEMILYEVICYVRENPESAAMDYLKGHYPEGGEAVC